ncbi:PfkB family carbohydrate kinase [Kineococcus endophyticus]|uniref:PfkB family carbohydrate kinase n=1 Tax=Kineococcus endophyticus TaxID=1181883 RepID=A0ABV3P7Q5_9ACTN
MNTSPHRGARVLVVGEALVDVVRHEDGRSAEHPGGSPLNVAHGLGRLGHRVQFLGRIGDDARGEVLQQHLVGAGVDLFPGSLVRGATSVARAQVDGEGRATYEFDLDSTLPRVQLPADLDHVHTGSIGASVPPGAATALELLRSARAVASTSYDPNVRPVSFSGPEQAVPLVEDFVAAGDVVKASDEDLRWLFPGEADVDVATRWLRTGPALVVVTRGAAGAVAVTGSGLVETRRADRARRGHGRRR